MKGVRSVPKNRNERLAADYREMLTIQDRPYLSWIVTKGELPYAEEYLLNISIRTYAFSMKEGRCAVGAINRCTVKVTLWPSYPETAPDIRMLNIPPAFHPHWYSRGVYCAPSPWRSETPLKDCVTQMLGTLKYDPLLSETESPANFKALDWYRKNRDNPALFPSDMIELTENSADDAARMEEAAATFTEIVDSWGAG